MSRALESIRRYPYALALAMAAAHAKPQTFYGRRLDLRRGRKAVGRKTVQRFALRRIIKLVEGL